MTLLEALVVVAITAMIAAIGFPALHAGDAVRAARSQSAALAADLRRAHAAAIHLDRPVALTPDRDGGGWRWLGGDFRVGPGLRIAAPQGAVVFYPDGTASGATFTLGTPAHPVGIAVGITVDRATGTVVTSGR